MPLTADDRLDIIALGNRFETAYDLADVELWLDCFTADGVLDQGEYGTFHGRDALREWFARFQGVFYDKRHLVTNHRVTPRPDSDDHAQLFYYFTVVERGGGPMIWGTATFTDDVVRQAGAWRISRAVQSFDANNGFGPGKYLFDSYSVQSSSPTDRAS